MDGSPVSRFFCHKCSVEIERMLPVSKVNPDGGACANGRRGRGRSFPTNLPRRHRREGVSRWTFRAVRPSARLAPSLPLARARSRQNGAAITRHRCRRTGNGECGKSWRRCAESPLLREGDPSRLRLRCVSGIIIYLFLSACFRITRVRDARAASSRSWKLAAMTATLV